MAGPHPAAVTRTTDAGRTGRSLAERLATRFPGVTRRVTRIVLDRRGLPGRDALIRYAYRRVYGAYNRGDQELNTLLLDPHEYMLRFGGKRRFMPDADDQYPGIEGYLEATSLWMSAWREPTLAFEDFIEVEPGLMVAMWRFAGFARGSEIKLDQGGADVQRLRDGYVVSQTFYWDRGEAFESVGLQPPGTRR